MCYGCTPIISTTPSFFIARAYYYSFVAFSWTREFNKISTETLPDNFGEIVYIFHLDVQVDFQISNYCDMFSIPLGNYIYQTSLPVTGAMERYGPDH